jgi:hypothetical protein
LRDRVATITLAVGVAAGTLFVAAALAQRNEIPSKEAWAGASVLAISYIVLAVLTALHQGRQVFDHKSSEREKQLSEAREALSNYCRTAAAHIDEACPNIRLAKVGIHIWVVTGRREKTKRLERTAAFTLKNRPTSAVVWRKGKGVLGTCWEAEKPVRVNLAENLYPKYPLGGDAEAFDALPEDERLGMTAAEVDKTRQYQAVVAFPLHRSTGSKDFVGALSVDLEAVGRYDEITGATWGDDHFSSIRGLCETFVERHHSELAHG